MRDKMADISLIQDVCMDDCDEGVYEQGDYPSGSNGNDEVLPPLSRVQKFAQSGNVYDRQLVARVVQDLFRTAPVDVLTKELPSIMNVIRDLGEKDEPMVRADLLEQVPHMASLALERMEPLRGVVGDYLIPLVVRNLGCSDNAVDKTAHSTLLHLMEQGLITRLQAEIQICPAVLALSGEEQSADINTGAITLMSKMAPLLGRDVTERIFLKRFAELCTSNMFYVRRVCASHIGDFCAVVGNEQFEKVLLPCYIALCQDEIWGVRKSSAEVVMFVSLVCPPKIRRLTLAPIFAKLLQDDCRWVQMSAFQTLGPFISTFADPSITNVAYNNQGELVFVNKEGNEFLLNSTSVPDVKLFKFMNKHSTFNTSSDFAYSSEDFDRLMPSAEMWSNDEETKEGEDEEEEDDDEDEVIENVVPVENQETLEEESSATDQDINQMVKSVKDVILGSVEQDNGIMKDILEENFDINNETCDNLASTINELSEDMDNTHLEDQGQSINRTNEVVKDKADNDVVQVNSEREQEEDDNLHLFNSYNYWYINPEMPIDIPTEDELSKDKSGDDSGLENLEDFPTINSPDDPSSAIEIKISTPDCDINNSADFSDTVDDCDQDIVPQVLINHFISMTEASLAMTIDNEMSYHCAYSLPAVALTLGNKNWPLLKQTIEKLASDMQYKVRRTVASSLHELALILGRDVATEYLTPIFEGFIKDLDEVRIGILRHLAYFLKLIKPAKRMMYLPRLEDFLKTEIEWNWRFRHELAKQLLLIVTLFKPNDSAKYLMEIAENLLEDVSAVRQVAILLITELLRYISTTPGLNSTYLVSLIQKFAHSKKWKNRQTFVLLCFQLLQSQALPPEQFASEVMPHLVDLSWDPVANVRLVVAKTIAQHIIPNEYFADPGNQHFASLGTVIRRLQADKDRDVRQYAQLVEEKLESGPPPPPPLLPN